MAQEPVSKYYFSWVFINLPWSVFMYFTLLGSLFAFTYYGEVRERESQQARLGAQLAEARLSALRMQLNPHFLFNALHTLAALVKFRPSAAEGAIERLGDMLRYTLKEDSRGVVEFSAEADLTRQYLAFEQLRYEDRLSVSLDIEASSFDFDVPPFSLQTLAENAVHHAIAIRPEGGSIWITSRRNGAGLLVSVRDDGPGNGIESGDSHQLGLRSVRERLIAAFGQSAELRIDRLEGGFQASFVVPPPNEEAEPASVAR